ncbi:MAG: putative DNA binding domain-containing protein [Oscillospiraceae bacterium]|nr:putative DNA binding domain-containing protein [Oscillospiraceae bacterium]
MAIPTNIRTLLSGSVVEWARIEFKTTWDAEASLKTITAFANDIDNWGGGYIVIGVEEENGIPVRPYTGVQLDRIDGWQKDIFEKCKLIRPAYTPIIGVDELDGRKFIIIWCPGGDTRPYSSPKTMAKNDKEKIYYIRKGSVTVAPNDDELKELFALANKTPFDDRVNHFADINDINYTLVKAYLKEIGSSLYDTADEMGFEELCKDMNLVSALPEYVKPRNVALMFFNSQPEKFFPYAQIDVVQFPEGEGGDKIIEQTFTGPLHEQLRAALRYIRNMVITEKVVKHPDRAEADRFFNYPYAAIEEALSNAVYHKGYDEREPIEVRVERDMIEIISHPGPDRSVTLEGLRTFKVRSRRYRNRRIGEFLKELHLTEGRNTGFKKILDAIKKNGSPMPEFETDEDHDYFITRLFIRDGFYDNDNSAENVVENDENGNAKSPGTSVMYDKSGNELNILSHSANKIEISLSKLIDILEFCSIPRTRAELQEFCGYKSPSHFRERILIPLLAGGQLAQTIPEKPNSPKQRYIRRSVSKLNP